MGSVIDGIRGPCWNNIEGHTFDVAIVGGGINGASIYHELCSRGYSVLLVDKGDFACGTSQASAMMIWGGLLYLRNLDFLTVFELSRARDAAINGLSSHVSPQSFSYIPSAKGGRNRRHVFAGLYLYWLLGNMRRKRPSVENRFRGLTLLKGNSLPLSLSYEEAVLRESDCRFVLHWITPFRSERAVPLNYCALSAGEYSPEDRVWSLDLADRIGERTATAKARVVLNCAGVWADEVNRMFSIDSPYKHVLSKGVFVGFRRAADHASPMIFEMAHEGDVLCFIPWGPVSLWGPTETKVDRVEDGFIADEEDVRFLLTHASANLRTGTAPQDIVSMRCGVRPLAVRKSYEADCYPLDLSRRSVIVEDREKPWISVYGGKLTGCKSVAAKVATRIERTTGVRKGKALVRGLEPKAIDRAEFPGLETRSPSMKWCVENELCCTLEDYLRRRTNISQWVPREGLGRDNENATYLLRLAKELHGPDEEAARREVAEYSGTVKARFDDLIARV